MLVFKLYFITLFLCVILPCVAGSLKLPSNSFVKYRIQLLHKTKCTHFMLIFFGLTNVLLKVLQRVVDKINWVLALRALMEDDVELVTKLHLVVAAVILKHVLSLLSLPP